MLFGQSHSRVICIGLISAAVMLAAPQSGGAAEIYKCVDENGRITFSQSPCGPKSEAIQIDESPASPVRETEQARAKERLEKLLKAQEERRARRLEEEKRQRAEREARKQDQVARRERCELARKNLLTLLIGRPVYRSDEKGERVFLDYAQRLSEIERMKDEIEEFCK